MADDKDIDELYKRTNSHNIRLAKIEAREPFLEDILSKNTQAYEKLSETLQAVQTSIVNLNAKMEAQEETMNSMRDEFTQADKATKEEINKANKRTTEEIAKVNKKTEEEINKISHRVDVIDDKGKFDIRVFINKYLPWIIVLIGAGIYMVSQAIKF